jgi:thioesterase domain-containing protein
MAAEGFRELAGMLPVPVYGLGWPKGAKPREEWPEKLDELAQIFLEEVKNVQPEGPYHLGGHSFGATVALKMAQMLEKAGERVELVVLLDPRSLPPLQADISYDFTEGGITNSLAILSQAGSAADGSRYSEMLDRVFTNHPDSPDRREAALKAEISPAVLASLEHMHATSVWYGKLIGDASNGEALKVTSGTIAVLRTAETWNEAPSAANPEGPAAASVREFEAKHFQSDEKVARLLEEACQGANLTSSGLPGDHFSMLRAPHALSMALRICRSLDEVQN